MFVISHNDFAGQVWLVGKLWHNTGYRREYPERLNSNGLRDYLGLSVLLPRVSPF
jgi:hypothetical protein